MANVPPSNNGHPLYTTPRKFSIYTMLARLSMLFLSALAVCTLFASSATAAVQRRDSQPSHLLTYSSELMVPLTVGSAIDSLTSEAGSLASAGTAEGTPRQEVSVAVEDVRD